MKPTDAEIQNARQVLKACLDEYERLPDRKKAVWWDHKQGIRWDLTAEEMAALRTIYNATAPDPGPPRPDDMSELARLVAKELRKRGIHATATHTDWGNTVAVPKCDPLSHGNGLRWQWHPMSRSDFDNLTPREIAIAIQDEEAKRAAEMAGDK